MSRKTETSAHNECSLMLMGTMDVFWCFMVSHSSQSSCSRFSAWQKRGLLIWCQWLKVTQEEQKGFFNKIILDLRFPKTLDVSDIRRKEDFFFLMRVTLTGTPNYSAFVFLPPRASGAPCKARGQEEPHLAQGKDDSRAACQLHSLMLFRLPHWLSF